MQTGEELILMVSSNVRRLRHSAGMSVSETAKRSGLPVQMWWRIEGGKSNAALKTLTKVCVGLANATLRTLTRIAAALQVNPAELFRPALKSRR
jgi:transcriptional regulator with XRE-family HTH domain